MSLGGTSVKVLQNVGRRWGAERVGVGGGKQKKLVQIFCPLFFFPLPVWNLDAMQEVEQPHCDPKVTIKRKGPKEGLSFDGMVELSLNKEKLLIWVSHWCLGFLICVAKSNP